ncbi:MAG: hypothetical protein KGJ49_08220 [Alphaproteobacteria bacterium]|nr:hypothetical protein [Alphaproteobacteria bacterium]
MKEILFGAIASVFVFSAAIFQPSYSSTSASADKTMTGVVIAYVERSRHWPKDAYSVQLNRTENGLLMYWVVYRKAPYSASFVVGNDGKSFVAVVDPAKRQVVREMAFQ